MMTKATKTFAIGILRRGSYRHWARYTTIKRANLGRNQYYCELCGIIDGKKAFQLDHKLPVVPVEGFDSFDGFIERLYCEPDGYQVLCIPCHQEKSNKENALRPPGNRAAGKRKKKK